MLVKICGVTSREDALAAADAGADAIGFNFWPHSPRFIASETAKAIGAALPPAILRVGVFVEAHSDEIADAAGVDIVQIHGEVVKEPNRRYWPAWPATMAALRERIGASAAEAFVIDAPAGAARGGTGRVFDWRLALGLPGRIILAGGLSADNVEEAIRAARPWGVDACSKLESAPGKKDHAKMRAFVQAARSVDL